VNIINNILKRVICLTLVCVFALSITPAVVFHDLFSGHTDYKVQHHHKHTNEIAIASVNCHFDSFVCSHSFVNLYTPVTFDPVINLNTFLAVESREFYSEHHFYAELRGPPTTPITPV
jgi:hypothetical protein